MAEGNAAVCHRCQGWGFLPPSRVRGDVPLWRVPCPACQGRNIIAVRRRTTGQIYDYAYWECPACGWHPGGSAGPPTVRCLNCGALQYRVEPEPIRRPSLVPGGNADG